MNDVPKIYVACLASYNNGILHGDWIEVDDYDSVMNEITKILKSSPIPDAEEWAIHDYEGFGEISLSEYESIESVISLANGIEEHGELFVKVYEYLNSYDEVIEMINDRYLGCYESVEDYAEEVTDLSGVPEHLQYYIDFESMGRDMRLNGEIDAIEAGYRRVYLFAA